MPEDSDQGDDPRATNGGWSPREAVASWTAGDVLRVLGILLFVVVVTPFVLFAVPQLAGAQHSYVVLSGSMEPAIQTGSIVLVQDVEPAAVESGDVITFGGSATGPPTTHRVVDIEQRDGSREFVTKGDNNENVDRETVRGSDLVGKVPAIRLPGVGPVLFSIPLVGHVVTFGQTTMGIVLLVVVPFGLLAIDSAIRTVRESRTDPQSDGPRDDPDSEEGTDHAGVVVLSPRALLMGAVVLVAAGALAGWYAFQRESVAAATFGTGLLTTGLLAGALPILDRGRGPASETAEADARITEGRVPPPLQSWPVLAVDSEASLRETSAEDGSLIVEDPDTGRLFLFRDGVAYTPKPDEQVNGETVADYLPEPTDYDAPEVEIDQSWDDTDGPGHTGQIAGSSPQSWDDEQTPNRDGGEP